MTIDSIPDSYFVGKRFTRDDLRTAVGRLNAELASTPNEYEVDPEISPAEAERTAEFERIIESALAGRDAE